MKKKVTLSLLLIVLLTLMSTLSYGQISQRNSYSNQFIRDCIIEVFQDQADDLVFNSNSNRLQVITNFYKKQLFIEYRPELREKEFESTDDLKLNNKYNPSLLRDNSYLISTFNPLKYNIQISPLNKMMYRIADTDYIIIVVPNK